VVCDEPVSSLDLSVQAQILNLLADLQAELAMSYLFIAHNLTVVRHLANQVIVLYRGQVAEYGSAELIYRRPAHPYTQALLASEPAPDPIVQRKRQGLDASSVAAQTTPAAVGSRTEGCVFADRCPLAIDPCRNDRPPLTKIPDGRSVACIRYPDTAGNGADVVTRSAVP
jgi:peptide/nickel transport system ATP-binding protein